MPTRKSTFGLYSRKCFDTHQERNDILRSNKGMCQSLEDLEILLNSLPPSSVKAEKCFSAAGLFILKLRSSLSDKIIDSLCFAHSYFVCK